MRTKQHFYVGDKIRYGLLKPIVGFSDGVIIESFYHNGYDRDNPSSIHPYTWFYKIMLDRPEVFGGSTIIHCCHHDHSIESDRYLWNIRLLERKSIPIKKYVNKISF